MNSIAKITTCTIVDCPHCKCQTPVEQLCLCEENRRVWFHAHCVRCGEKYEFMFDAQTRKYGKGGE